MSRPSSWYDDSLPQFSTTTSSSIRQLPSAPSYHHGSPSYHPSSSAAPPPPPPPPSGSSYHGPSSPYTSDPNRTTSMYAPPPPQHQQQRPSTLYGGSQSTGGTSMGVDLLPSHTTGNSSSASSAFSLARSASLGGTRRKDPFGNQIDDVERALGGTEEQRGPIQGGWSDGGAQGGQLHSQYSNSLAGAFGGAGFSRGGGGGGGGDIYQGGGGGSGGAMVGGLEGGGGVGHSGLMSVSMLPSSSSSSQQALSSRGQDRTNLMGPPPPQTSSSNRTQSIGPPPQPQPQPSSSSSSYQPQQHYSLGQPPPPSQNPYIPQQLHASSSSSAAYDPSNVGGGHSPSSAGHPPPSTTSTTNWSSSYSPLPSPHVDMRTSPLPRPPALPQHSLSYTAGSSNTSTLNPHHPPSPHLLQYQLHHQQPPSSSSYQQQSPSNPYAPTSSSQHPQPLQPPSSSQPYSSSQQPYTTASSSASPYAPHTQPHPSSSSAYSSPQTQQTDSIPTPASYASRGTPSPTGLSRSYGANAGGSQLYSRDGREGMGGMGGGEGGPPKAKAGFRKVRGLGEVKPVFSERGGGRTSPLTSLTSQLALTYSSCNPQFRYEVAHNPRRVLTKPSKGVLNDGHDNEENDYILYVNDWLGTEEGHKYLILDVLGQGTFGQVVKCQNMKTNEVVAVKVIKNKPAYFNQSMMEVAILDELNTKCDPHDTHNILRMRTHFIHCKHLCLVFECLSSNLYELIKQNSFRGLSTQLVKVFTTQLLDTLTVLHEARLIHCDLKPENILLKSLQSPHIKVIDFGSACHEYSTVYTYIQSRFYRSPEVLLGLPYSTAIDMWSLGCIAVELFLGLPLFPGTSEYNQLSRIIEMLGLPPNHLLENGKQVHEFFNSEPNPESSYGRGGGRVFRLKSMEQYSKEHNTNEQPSKQYFKASTLPEIIKGYAFAKKGAKQGDVDKEMAIRASFTDFVLGLLNLDPIKRWSPQQAMLHPFITGEKFTGPFDPRRAQSAHQQSDSMQQQQQQHASQPQQQPVDPKRPYGGLVVNTASRTPRAYQDAATYNQQLAHHQTYTAQQQAAQAAASAYRHPFAPADDSSAASYNQQQQQQRAYQAQQAQAQAQQQLHLSQQQQQQHQRISGGSASSGLVPSSYSVRNSTGAILPPPAAAHPSNPPSNAYFPSGGRNRANTIGQMDVVPPQLARITNLGVEQSQGGRSALTPVMNREEMMREWERRNAQGASGKRASVNQTWPQLEFLEGQAESLGWGPSSNARYAGGGGGGGIQFPPPPMTVIVDDGSSSSRSRQLHQQHQRDHSMSRDVSMGGGPESRSSISDPSSNRYDPSPSPNSIIPQAPPQAYSIGAQNNARYSASYQPPHPLLLTSSSANDNSSGGYDVYDPHRDGLGTLIQPLIPSAQGSSSNFGQSPSSSSSRNYNGGPQQQQQRNNPFVGGGGGASTSPNSPNAIQSSFGFMGSPQQQLLQKKKSAGALEGWR